VISTAGERKCALLLTSLGKRDQRSLLARLPKSSSATIRALMLELDAMQLPLAELANELLATEVRGLTASTSLELDQLISLSERLPPVWFAHVLAAWPNVDRNFCLATLDRSIAVSVRQELERIAMLPANLADALRAQAIRMVSGDEG
jgi:hypothetical protein